MAVIIGSARIDENGRAHGGKSGDNNGRELSTQNWYRHSKGWVLLRPKNPNVAALIASNMRAACANQRIGYDQYQRDTLYAVAKPLGFDVAKVAVKCETDCSALVRVCVCYALGKAIPNFRTTNQATVLMATGQFFKLTDNKYTRYSDYLRVGDILVTKSQGHTVVVLSDGSKAEATITPTVPVPAPLDPEKPYMANWVIATAPVNVRTGPGENYRKYVTLLPGTGLMYDGAISGEWYAVMWRGKRHWVSSLYARIEVREKPIVDLSVYDYVTDWLTFSKWISFVFHRVGVRSIRSNGTIKRDGKFPASAAIMQKLGIPFGAYFYGRAKTVAGAREEADRAMEWAEPYGVKVYAYDIETPTNNQAAVQAFIDRIAEKTGKPCGIYAGRRWNQVNGDKLRKAFAWCPYYRKNGGGTHGDREPSHPHDFHQYSCSARFPGKTDDTDVSHVSGTGRGIEWLRSGGKGANAK